MLKGYDDLANIVLHDTIEYLRGKIKRLFFSIDPSDPYNITDETRKLGVVVLRGPSLMMVTPMEGYEEIDNPYVTTGDDAE